MRTRPLIWISIILVLSSLMLAGCGKSTEPATNTASDQSTDQSPSVASPPSGTQSPSTEASAQASDTGIVAYVDSIPITDQLFERAKSQVLARYQQLYAQFGQDVSTLLQGADGRLFELRIENDALEAVTTRALISEELANNDASVSDDAVEAEFQTQYDQFLSSLGMTEQDLKDAFESGELAGMQTGGLTFDEFIAYAKQTVREQLELDAVQHLIAGPIDYTEDDLMSYFEDHRSDYNVEEQVRASHILVDSEELAQQLHDQLENGADFAELAREYSQDTGTAATGGDLGWFTRGQMIQAFEDAAFSTPVGQISDVIQTQYGYHIILVTDYKPASSPEYADVADQVAEDYQADIRAQRFNDWYTGTRPTAQITIEDPVLAAYRLQQNNTGQGLQAFLDLRDEGTVDEKYLSYIIGTIYESMMEDAQSQKQQLESGDAITDSQQQQIDALNTEIAARRSQAIAAYQDQLAQLGGEDAQIEQRIAILQSNSQTVAEPPASE